MLINNDMNIKIGTFDYKLRETNKPLLMEHIECGGIINYDNLTIDIKKDLEQQRKSQTILHEVFHAIIKEYDIDIEEIDEEYLVDILGTAMFQIIKDNKKLIKYIGGK